MSSSTFSWSHCRSWLNLLNVCNHQQRDLSVVELAEMDFHKFSQFLDIYIIIIIIIFCQVAFRIGPNFKSGQI